MERRVIFYNVLTGSLSQLSKPDSYFTDPKTPNFKKSPRWYTKESDPSFYDPYILVSAPHNRNKDIKKSILVGEDTTVFGDSGGFQLAMIKDFFKKWDRKKSLKWLEKNADVFPILDLPTGGKCNPDSPKNQLSPHSAKEYSVKSAKFACDNRSVEGKKILNVLSAGSLSQMKFWYPDFRHFPLDGWAIGGHANHLKTILSGILFLVGLKEFDTDEPRPLHLFGTTSMGVIPYAVYAQHLLNKKGINVQISFDSSSASALANYGSYIRFCTPTGATNSSISNKYDWSKLDNFSNLGCDCPICRDVDDIGYLFSDEGKGQFYTIMAMHNYWKMRQYKLDIEGVVSLDCQEANDSLPLEMKKNFIAMKEAFDKPGLGGIDVIQNRIITSRNKQVVNKKSSQNIRLALK